MSISHLRFRLAMFGAALGFLAVALGIRVLTGSGALTSGGRWEQYSGTALYASMIYVGALFLLPRLSPTAAGATAWAWCWAVEFLQLTGIPAALSARSLLARLALGVHFDPVDLIWYPIGILPLVAIHYATRKTSRRDY